MSIKRSALAAFGALTLAWAPAAHALVQTTYPVGSPSFTAVAAPNGVITGTIAVIHQFADTFEDTFTFTVPVAGTGSGSLSTSTTRLAVSPDLDFTSITFNGVSIPIVRLPSNGQDFIEIASVISTPVPGDPFLNKLVVKGVSTNPSGYGGTITFTSTPVPEASTWAIMLLGFGLTGMTMRSRKTKAASALAAA